VGRVSHENEGISIEAGKERMPAPDAKELWNLKIQRANWSPARTTMELGLTSWTRTLGSEVGSLRLQPARLDL
jgi:hypothetical protein